MTDFLNDLKYCGFCGEDKVDDTNDQLGILTNKIYQDASRIGKKAILFNKDDLPEFIERVHFTKSELFSLNYRYNKKIPFVTQCVAYALEIVILDYTVDDDGIPWIHDAYHNIVFDENGKQIGHFVYQGRDSQKVILYKKPTKPYMREYLEEDQYDFEDYDPPTIPREEGFSDELKKVLKSYGINDAKYTFDNNEDEWIYSRKTNVIFNVIGEQIGHMVFPFSIKTLGKAIIYEKPTKPKPYYIWM
jgi:hypothetical protein